jgi:hypothetical protein
LINNYGNIGQKKQWGNYKDIYVNKRPHLNNFLNVISSNVNNVNESINLNETYSKLEEKNTLSTIHDEKLDKFTTPKIKLKSRMDKFLLNNTTETCQKETLNTFVSFTNEDSKLVTETENNLEIKTEKIINSNLTTEQCYNIDTNPTYLKTEKLVEQTLTTINKYASPVKKVEINMRIDLKSGAVKNFLHSNMKNSVKEQYDKYVKKSILLNSEKRKVSRENSVNLRINLSKDKKEITQQIQVPVLKRESSSQVYNTFLKLKIPSKLSDIPLPYSNKKKILNTSVLSAKDEKSSVCKTKHVKNLSYDENFIERKIRTNVNTKPNTPTSKENKIENLLTDINSKNNSKIQFSQNRNVLKRIFFKDIGNLSSRKPEQKESNKFDILKSNLNNHKFLRPICRVISKSPDSPNKLKLFNNEQKLNRIKNYSPRLPDEKSKKFRGISQDEQILITKPCKDKILFPAICCKQNLDQIKFKLEEICGKGGVILLKNKVISFFLY